MSDKGKLIGILKRKEFGNIFDFQMNKSNTATIDFSSNNKDLDEVNTFDTSLMNKYIFDFIYKNNARVGVGGYNEERIIYKRSSKLFSDLKGNPRFIHLGIDLWIETGTKIFSPLDGILYSSKDNLGFGDFGPTLIVKHNLGGINFYTLYGHLTRDSLLNKSVGDNINEGDYFCKVGNFPINGDWPPHLHFQIILDMLNYDGDYAAVCSLADRNKFLELCPDPNLILKIPSLK